MTCEQCGTTDNISLYRHAITNKRYCYRCWGNVKPDAPVPLDRCSDAVKNAAALGGGVVWRPAAIAQAERERAEREKQIATVIEHSTGDLVVSGHTIPKRPELTQCALCETWGNDGAWIDSQLYWCGTCLADIEEGGMHTKHIKLKLRGSDKAIAFFHYVCAQIDNDWPWNPKKPEPKECEKCGGVLYQAAVLEPEQIRTIAEQAGVGKCKIPYFGEVKFCYGR